MADEAHEDSTPIFGLSGLVEAAANPPLSPSPRSHDNGVVDLTGDSDDEPKTGHNPHKPNVIDLDDNYGDDDGDEDLRRAIALSMLEANALKVQEETVLGGTSKHDATKISNNETTGRGPTPKELEIESDGKNANINVNAVPSNAFGILGLDRKKQEEERLARVAKRKAEASISPPPLQRDAKLARRDVSHINDDAILLWPNSASTPRLSQSPAKTDFKAQIAERNINPQAVTQAPLVSSLCFPKGVVKKTWAFGCPRDGDDIKIEEVLQSADLELAILSAFQWDMDWLFRKLRAPIPRLLLVMQAKEESTKLQYIEETANMPNIRLCFPPMDGQVNCMHSKLMLLFHPEYLRIVVPSANLVPYDWGEQGGVMENTAFIIDLPKVSKKTGSSSSETPFYGELVYFLKASTLHENLVAKLSNFDFKETARYAFVHTIGGSHMGESWTRTGHCGLGRAVRSLGLKTNGPVKIDFVASSIGSLTEEFMRSIYLSAQGDDGRIEYALRTSKVFPVTTGLDRPVRQTTGAEWKKHFRVYYPSKETVSNSKGGTENAGTICFQERWFEGAKFPRHALYDCISRRSGLLMHNKMMFIRPADASLVTRPDGSHCIGWAYVGSANLSESAWGRIVHDRAKKEPKLNCRNWECGVLVPVVSEDKTFSTSVGSQSEEVKDITQIFGTTVPVPMLIPAPPLGNDLKPWYSNW